MFVDRPHPMCFLSTAGDGHRWSSRHRRLGGRRVGRDHAGAER